MLWVLCLVMPASNAIAASCPEMFAGGVAPVVVSETMRSGTVLLCNGSYAVLASERTRGPLWSAEDLTEENLEIADRTPRQGKFLSDLRLPVSMQALPQDYRASGYDRGHMTPSGDEPGLVAQQESFLLSNIVPQTKELNRGPWEGLESTIRAWAREEGEVFVVTGPGYDPDRMEGRIPVPAVTWKAVYDPAAQGAGAYVCVNTATPTCRLTTVSLLTQLVGIDPFPSVSPEIKGRVGGVPPLNTAAYGTGFWHGARHRRREDWGHVMMQKAVRAFLRALRP